MERGISRYWLHGRRGRLDAESVGYAERERVNSVVALVLLLLIVRQRAELSRERRRIGTRLLPRRAGARQRALLGQLPEEALLVGELRARDRQRRP